MRLVPFDPRSLRVRLMLLAALSIGLTLLVAGVTLSVVFERHIERRIADELSFRWTELAGSLRLDAEGRPELARNPADPRYGRPLSGAYWQVDAAGGAPLRSRSLWDRRLETPADAPTDAAFEIDGFEPDSEFYVVSRPVVLTTAAGGDVPLTLTVALDHDEIQAARESFDADLVKALLVIAGALLAGALLQAHLGLSPLKTLRRRIAAIRAGRTDRLGAGFPSEIQPLADDLDRLLDRQDVLIGRARDRAGALAHGFKTPLTILTLESRRLADAGDADGARVLREQVEIMRRHVERELARARIRGSALGGSALGAGRAAELGLTVHRLVDTVRRLPFSDRIDFSVDVPAELRIRMDRDDLGEVVGNLLDNARKFAVSAIAVRAVVDAAAGLVRVEVADDGPGFDRPAAPERNHDGSGLGLAIVEDVLGAYGTHLTRDRNGGRTVVGFTIGRAEPTWEGKVAAE